MDDEGVYPLSMVAVTLESYSHHWCSCGSSISLGGFVPDAPYLLDRLAPTAYPAWWTLAHVQHTSTDCSVRARNSLISSHRPAAAPCVEFPATFATVCSRGAEEKVTKRKEKKARKRVWRFSTMTSESRSRPCVPSVSRQERASLLPFRHPRLNRTPSRQMGHLRASILYKMDAINCTWPTCTMILPRLLCL